LIQLFLAKLALKVSSMELFSKGKNTTTQYDFIAFRTYILTQFIKMIFAIGLLFLMVESCLGKHFTAPARLVRTIILNIESNQGDNFFQEQTNNLAVMVANMTHIYLQTASHNLLRKKLALRIPCMIDSIDSFHIVHKRNGHHEKTFR
jgi:hypothetical protein